MPKENPSLYSVSKTFVWFAIVSVILLGSLVAIVVLDHKREWKDWQKKFIELKRQKAQSDLKELTSGIDHKKAEELGQQLKAADAELSSHRVDLKEVQGSLDGIATELTKQKTRAQDLKQFQDSYRYYFEEYTLHKDPRAAEYDKKLKEISPKVIEAKFKQEEIEKRQQELINKITGITSKESTLKKNLDKLFEEKSRAEKRLKKLEPSLATEVLNAPMLDFIAPTYEIQQVVLEDLYDDYHFAKVQKVDRCVTCHLGIDQKGFENAPQPFRTHPKLDTFLSAASPHPVEKFGCTVCHSGNGHSVSFVDSAHTPKDEKQKAEWKKKYRWHELEKWDKKMLPLQHTEAACAKCHTSVWEVPKADKLNEGRRLAETYGCVNCHKIKNFESPWKVGPDLQNIKSKLSEDWVIRWLDNPMDFRASTKMPRIFHLSNTSGPEDKAKSNAAIYGITHYLLKHSGEVSLEKPPVAGNAVNGEKLVKDLGCLGCHTAAGVSANNYGPELTGLGSKVTPEWLYSWVKNPKHYSQETRMPNLRLSDQEASDITAYLLTLRNPEFENKKVSRPNPQVANDLALTFLRGSMRDSEAREALGKMSEDDKWDFIGKKSIAHQGCFSCHSIAGFGEFKPIGAELSNEGRKDLHQFDFGFVDIEQSRQDWFMQKLKDPRSFDQGKVKDYHDKLRMPQFNLSEEERGAITTFVLSLTEERMPLEMQRRLTTNDEKVEKGRLLIKKMNCAGCHTLDGHEGGIRKAMEDNIGAAPPVLEGEGSKVKEAWLHAFLQHPTPIRPWLSYRMPSFDFSDEELKALVEYFAFRAHQEVSYKGYEVPPTNPEKIQSGQLLFEKFQCVKCHQVNASSAAMGTSFLAPDLALTKNRLKPDWVKDWIKNPEAIQEGTMMPGFFPDGQSPVEDILGGDAEKQIEAIRDYLYQYEPASVPEDNSKKGK